LIFSAIFLGVRLINLTLLPPYIDEAVHVRHALNLLNGGLVLETEAGKFLQIWLITPVLALEGNPFWKARVISIWVGLCAAVGCYGLGQVLFQRREVGWVAAFLYLIVPYAVFLDRLVLNDNLLAMVGIYILLLSLKLTHQARPRSALALGLMLGLGGLTKINGFIWWLIPLLTAIIWQVWSAKLWRYLGAAYLLALMTVSPFIITLPEQLSAVKNKTLLLAAPPPISLSELWLINLQQTLYHIQTYLTWPILAMVIAGLALSLFQQRRSGLLLAGLALIYVAAFDLTTVKYIQSRYLFPIVPLLLSLAGYAVVRLSDWLRGRISLFLPARYATYGPGIIQASLVVLLAPSAIRFDYLLLFNPVQAPLEASDHWLFVEGFLSGYGLKEVSAFLRVEAARRGPIVVVRHDQFSLTREGLDITLRDVKHTVKLVTLNLVVAPPAEMVKRIKKEKDPVFVVLNLPLPPGAAPFTVNFADTPYCRQVAIFFKPNSSNNITIYECGVP
jgi:4-amino-4-deoxy-L-arabinose transferase-like glycosyltransferase